METRSDFRKGRDRAERLVQAWPSQIIPGHVLRAVEADKSVEWLEGFWMTLESLEAADFD